MKNQSFDTYEPLKSAAEKLLEKLKPELIKTFSKIPEYGQISFSVKLNESEPVHYEHSISESLKLQKKELREVNS